MWINQFRAGIIFLNSWHIQFWLFSEPTFGKYLNLSLPLSLSHTHTQRPATCKMNTNSNIISFHTVPCLTKALTVLVLYKVHPRVALIHSYKSHTNTHTHTHTHRAADKLHSQNRWLFWVDLDEGADSEFCIVFITEVIPENGCRVWIVLNCFS